MLLGKRPRPPIKRTTSMTKITFDLNTNSEPPPSDQQNPMMGFGGGADGGPQWQSGGIEGLDQRLMAAVSPRNHRRYSADFKETASFLKSCYLCKRRLVPARDIYMYRGDSAFCSLECRQQQMNQDERKEKCSLASKKEATSSTKGETVAAL